MEYGRRLLCFAVFIRTAMAAFGTPLRARFPYSKYRLASDLAEEFGRRDSKFQERSNRWVVLVDDEEPIRKAVGQYLFEQGYEVTACADATTALDVSQSKRVSDGNGIDVCQPPDVVVSDIRMSGMDGLQMLGEFRSNAVLVEVPVVLLTAKGQTQDRIAGYKAGADAYITKPFDPQELLSIIDNLIVRHETLNGGNIEVEDLKRDLDEIKYLLQEQGGAGIGNGWVEDTNVFLTPNERRVLELICQGQMTKEIAAETFLSTRRIEQLLTSMFRKTNTSNRTELVRWAISSGNVQI